MNPYKHSKIILSKENDACLTRATLVGGLRGRQMLNHCAIPAPPIDVKVEGNKPEAQIYNLTKSITTPLLLECQVPTGIFHQWCFYLCQLLSYVFCL